MIFKFIKLNNAERNQLHLVTMQLNNTVAHDVGTGVNAKYDTVRMQAFTLYSLQFTVV